MQQSSSSSECASAAEFMWLVALALALAFVALEVGRLGGLLALVGAILLGWTALAFAGGALVGYTFQLAQHRRPWQR